MFFNITKKFLGQTLLIIILSIFIGFFIVLVFPNAYLFAWITGIFLIIMGLYPLVKGMQKRKIDIFEPIYLFTAYYILEMGIRGIWNLEYNSPGLNQLYDTTSSSFYYLISKVFLFSILGLIIFYIGYYLKIGTIIANSLPKIPKVYWNKYQLAAAIFFSFFVGIFPIFLTIKRGIEVGKDYIIISLATIPLVGLSLLYLKCSIEKRRLLEIFLIFLILLFSSSLFFFLHAGKATMVETGILILVLYHYLNRYISVKKVIFIILLSIPILSFVWGYRSLGNFTDAKNYFISAISHPSELFTPILIRSYGTDAFAVILDKTDEFKIGGSLGELVWFYMPRQIWPEKPYSYSYVFGKEYLTTQAGPFVIPSLIGEFYLNFAWVGIIIGFLLTGIILKAIYAYFVARNDGKISILLYALIIPRLIFLPEGSIASGVAKFLTSLIFALVVVSILMIKIPSKNRLILDKKSIF